MATRNLLLTTLKTTVSSLILCATLFGITSCATGVRTIYVPDGTPVRLRQSVKGVDCWVLDKNGTWAPGKVTIPEGWYALPADAAVGDATP